MNENPLESNLEKLKPKFEIVESPSPEILRAIKELRISVTQNPEDAFYLVTSPKKEMAKTSEQTREEFFGKGKFIVAVKVGSDLVGMNRAEERENGLWYVGGSCVRADSRGVGQKMAATRLIEIRRRGGKKVIVAVKKRNSKNIHILQKLGFTLTRENNPFPHGGFDMELDLTDPEIVKKIESILNAG